MLQLEILVITLLVTTKIQENMCLIFSATSLFESNNMKFNMGKITFMDMKLCKK